MTQIDCNAKVWMYSTALTLGSTYQFQIIYNGFHILYIVYFEFELDLTDFNFHDSIANYKAKT